jgi:hypothetical protein
VNVYATPFVSPEITHCVELPVPVLQVNPDGEAVTTAPVSWLPPLNEGSVHDTDTRPSPAFVWTLVGASGIVNGVTGTEGSERGELPAKLAAVTVKAYAVPLDNPSTSHEVATFVKVVHCRPPGLDVTVYPRTSEPPLEAGGDHDTVARPSPGRAMTSTGAPATVNGATGSDSALDSEDPATLIAVTVTTYGAPFVRSVNVHSKT